MDRNQLSTKQENDAGASAKQGTKTRRNWTPGRVAAGIILIILLCTGGFLSLFPLGRAFTRIALLLPALLSDSAPAPLVVAGDPVRVTHLTLFPHTSYS